MRDTVRDHPVGFERERKNIFDPEEDNLDAEITEATAEKDDADPDKDITGEIKETESNGEHDDESEEESKPTPPARCARTGCNRRPRFDSRFCSDSCGVSALELDLLYSFQESSDIHPSVLRN
jgi:hypothetical protein